MENLYKKICVFFVENTIDAKLKENNQKIIFTLGKIEQEFESYEDMYSSLEISEALYNDYEEEPELLEDYEITEDDLKLLKII